MPVKLLFILLSLSISVCYAVNIGCPKENKKEIQKFAKQVEKARACHVDSDCTTHKFYKIGNGCQTFDSAINKTQLKYLIKKSKALPYCHQGIGQCLIYIVEKDEVICKNQLCTVTYKIPQPPQN